MEMLLNDHLKSEKLVLIFIRELASSVCSRRRKFSKKNIFEGSSGFENLKIYLKPSRF